MELSNHLHKLKESFGLETFIRRYGIFIVFLVITISLAVSSSTFRTPANLINILQQNSVYAIVACGMLLMIIVGGFDLSVGAVAALSNVTAAYIFKISSIPLGIIGGLMLGLLAGVFNGILITKARINPFVATLGSSTLIRGLLFVSTNAEPIYGLPSSYTVIGMGSIGPVPIAAVIAGLVILFTLVILHFTLFGHHIFSVGGNEEAARLAGINVERIKIATYGIGGFFAALGGLILLSQSNIGQPSVAEGLPLTIIAIVVIGGTPLTGGVGNISAPIIGTLMLGVISNGLNLLNASPYWKPALTGLIVIMAVASERYWAVREKD
ncbi:ABC transporter permease [Candidatus Bipolaricaulota bacterium]|nr:ABC transporter permease [Candidatus Bipolaricaulota bacterium]